jgi:hypothetical protein
MARKTISYKIEDEGRDKGKLFFITEMSSEQAEDWAFRVLLALMAGNVELPEGFETLGMSGLAQLGLKALTGLKYDIAKPLLAEMFTCLQIIPDPSKTMVVRALVPDDIEEVSTRFRLRMEIFNLHTDFLVNAAPSIFPSKRGTAAASGQSHTRISQKR